MKLNWEKSDCSCEVVPTGGYRGEHDGAHTSESPWGTYIVKPHLSTAVGPRRFCAQFACACCREVSTLTSEDTWVNSYRTCLEHFGDMFKRRMMP
jgi:hypothetical protein